MNKKCYTYPGIQSRETLEEQQGPLRSTEECTIHQKPLPYSPEIDPPRKSCAIQGDDQADSNTQM